MGVLTAFSSLQRSAWAIVACSIYGTTLILLYATSTLYHAIPIVRAKEVLRVLDHSAIFLLIAGTYTPFTLISLRGPWGWSLFGVVWGLAVLGILARVTVLRRFRLFRVGLYAAMGWVVLVAIKPMLSAVPAGGLILLLCGGLAYSLGIVFYLPRQRRYHHAIWHAFVLLGSLLHYFAILLYVVPMASPRHATTLF